MDYVVIMASDSDLVLLSGTVGCGAVWRTLLKRLVEIKVEWKL
jgi:hypothetical protein